MIRTQQEIEIKIEYEKNQAKDLMKLHVESNDDGTYLRMYNKTIERIKVLEWVLRIKDIY